MLLEIVPALYFFLPAYVANMMPVFFARFGLPFDQPISENKFGAHKTWRGFLAGFTGAFIVLYIQKFLFLEDGLIFNNISILNYQDISIFLYSSAFGIGALTGDLVKSFLKRQIGIPSGDSWFPFDQLDFVLGAILFIYPLYQISFEQFLIILIITPLLHLIISSCGYFLGLKKVWW